MGPGGPSRQVDRMQQPTARGRHSSGVVGKRSIEHASLLAPGAEGGDSCPRPRCRRPRPGRLRAPSCHGFAQPPPGAPRPVGHPRAAGIGEPSRVLARTVPRGQECFRCVPHFGVYTIREDLHEQIIPTATECLIDQLFHNFVDFQAVVNALQTDH
jgi:hypothetical protein